MTLATLARATVPALALALCAGCTGGPQGPVIAAGVDDDPTAKWAGRGAGLDGKPDDAATPVVFKITAPAADAVLESGAAVEVSFTLENYTLKKGEDGTGNHVHFILDNEPYVPVYGATQPYVLKDVAEGTHVLRAFASRPWHESWKNPEAFGWVVFSVKAKSEGGPAFDPKAPLLTYSRPKGTYKGADIDKVLLDFWVSGCTLGAGTYQVRYTVDGKTPQVLSEWRPVWLAGLGKGTHTILLELLDADSKLVTANAWNRTERKVTLE